MAKQNDKLNGVCRLHSGMVERMNRAERDVTELDVAVKQIRNTLWWLAVIVAALSTGGSAFGPEIRQLFAMIGGQ